MIMVNEFCRTDVARGELVDASTRKPYNIPMKGTLKITMFYQCETRRGSSVLAPKAHRLTSPSRYF
jgi:hypothetical protein